MDEMDLDTIRHELDAVDALGRVRWALAHHPGAVTCASSLGQEDQILLHLIAENGLDIPVFTLDTGRLFSESYDLMVRSERRYGRRIAVYCPQASAVEELVAEHGIDCYRRSVALRQQCCAVRKLEPLKRALAGHKVWICGLRREQSVTRHQTAVAEWDEAHGMLKINPLIDWSYDAVQHFVTTQDVPCHPLHDQGYPSIGCACCTRAVMPGEDIRAGRWWWEQPEHRECGLHHR